MPHYFVPMLVEEFTNLLRLDALRLPQGRWHYAEPAVASGSTKTAFITALKEITPTFEDTISIVIVQFARCASDMAGQHILAKFSFTDAVATYALTHHDREVLSTRLSPAAKLAPRPLIDESDIRDWKQALFVDRALQGAQALLMIYQGRPPASADEGLLQSEELRNALVLRQQDHVSPVSSGSYLDNLICYSRSGPIPNTDPGFLHDCALILKNALNRTPDRFGVGEAIERHKVAQSSLAAIANDLVEKGVAPQFDEYVKIDGALVSSLVFLKLSHEIREHNRSLSRAQLQAWLGEIRDQRSVARGVWWCGGFWGFTQFAEEYYAIASLTPAPLPDRPAIPTPATERADSPVGVATTDASAPAPVGDAVATVSPVAPATADLLKAPPAKTVQESSPAKQRKRPRKQPTPPAS